MLSNLSWFSSGVWMEARTKPFFIEIEIPEKSNKTTGTDESNNTTKTNGTDGATETNGKNIPNGMLVFNVKL